jgi:hypothetical protein
MSTTTTLDTEEAESPWYRRSTGAWLADSCTWRWRGRTFSFLCVCALVFRRRRGLHISRPSSGFSGIFDTVLSSVFGIRHPLLFRFLGFRMPILQGVSFWDLRLFLGLLANSLV